MMSMKGFSVIELVVVIPLIAMVAFFLSYVGIYHFQTYYSEIAELNITNDIRNALDDIDNYTRQANRVLLSYSTYSTGTNILVLQIPSINGSGAVIEGTYDNVVFYLSGSDFFEQIFPNASSSRVALTKKMANNVSSLTFSYDNADYSLVKQVTANITITQNAGTSTRSINISSQSKLRNY